jgi:methyltransferase (TIGR00027 family)
MKPRQASKTAEAAAAIRAAHLLHDHPVVFRDPYALQMTSPAWRAVVRHRLLNWLIVRRLLTVLRPVHGQVLGRARYCEDALEVALGDGVGQYVMVGAGFDSFALRRRDLSGRVTIYELDHPDTQALKRKRLVPLDGKLSLTAVFVPVDLQREAVGVAVRRSSFRPEERAFFSWLGTTHYLLPEVVLATLRSIASIASEGSELVFDYGVDPELLDDDGRRELDALKRFVERRGEPIASSFRPERLFESARTMGFEVVEDVSHHELMRRYFAGRGDDLRTAAFSRIARLRMKR